MGRRERGLFLNGSGGRRHQRWGAGQRAQGEKNAALAMPLGQDRRQLPKRFSALLVEENDCPIRHVGRHTAEDFRAVGCRLVPVLGRHKMTASPRKMHEASAALDQPRAPLMGLQKQCPKPPRRPSGRAPDRNRCVAERVGGYYCPSSHLQSVLPSGAASGQFGSASSP